jgi:hypothetical protein
VSRGYSSSCVLSFRLLPADSAVGPFCNWRTSPSVTSCTFLVASGRVGPGCLRSTACSGSWLYCLWLRCLDTMMLVKPATVIQWHPQGFRLYWLPHAEEAQKAPVCGMKAVTCGMAMNFRAGPWKLSLALTLDPSAR